MTSFARASAAALAAVACALLAGETATAQSTALRLPAGVIPPPSLSHATSEYFKNHPKAWSNFVAKLPRLNAPARLARRFVATVGGTWTVATNAPAGTNFCSPHLLHNGIVIVQVCLTGNWYRLKPTKTGSYINGTWAPIASMPVIDGTQYGPLAYASGVLPDGRFIAIGGEYNLGSSGTAAENYGAIYDPVADTWTPVTKPAGAGTISDAQSVGLADGTFMLGPCCDYPATAWLLNASDLTWTQTGAPSAAGAYQDEQGYELLPNSKILTVDIWTNYPTADATNAEQYDPATGTWGDAGTVPVSLADPGVCGTYEIGPAVVRGDNRVIAFGGHSNYNPQSNTYGCDPNPDPTAILNTDTGVWTGGPDIPSVCGAGGTDFCDLADAPAAVLRNGNILFAASSGFGDAPTHFFEWALQDNTISEVSDPVTQFADRGAYNFNFVVLPNGQILMTNFGTPEIYATTGTTVSTWRPTISSAPSTITRNHTYRIGGRQLNGRSAGAYYGDDFQSATNFPLVRIVNNATGHVFYGKSTEFTTLSIKPTVFSSFKFKVPSAAETGASTLYVVANGIASAGSAVTVQ